MNFAMILTFMLVYIGVVYDLNYAAASEDDTIIFKFFRLSPSRVTSRRIYLMNIAMIKL